LDKNDAGEGKKANLEQERESGRKGEWALGMFDLLALTRASVLYGLGSGVRERCVDD
jgi:hypothetical protein